MTARPLRELVDEGWAGALEPVADRITAMGEFLRAEIADGHRYLPAGPNVLRAFTFPFDAVRVLIVGHTDMTGEIAANLTLSRARAAAVVTQLTTVHGIAAARLLADGVGPLSPVASNADEAGRQQNRRVEIVLR